MVFNCKMCGSPLKVDMVHFITKCEFCGTEQSYPRSNDEAIQNMYDYGNKLRQNCEFDKAEEVFGIVLSMDPSDPEIYWCQILCRNGIEYVKDPKTGTGVPTCHRTVLETVEDSEEYFTLEKLASKEEMTFFQKEADRISQIQQEIILKVAETNPYDVFLCYKETDEFGNRTEDSFIAEKIYNELTDRKLSVFYAAKTLEDKAGEEFEPIIFSALCSSKVMVVVGTRPDYFDAVWVRNEWARYIHFMKDHSEKKYLIPVCAGADIDEMPEPLKAYQAYELNGEEENFQELIRQICERINKQISSGNLQQNDTSFEEGFRYLQYCRFEQAKLYWEKVSPMDEYGEYLKALGLFMADLHIPEKEDIYKYRHLFDLFASRYNTLLVKAGRVSGTKWPEANQMRNVLLKNQTEPIPENLQPDFSVVLCHSNSENLADMKIVNSIKDYLNYKGLWVLDINAENLLTKDYRKILMRAGRLVFISDDLKKDLNGKFHMIGQVYLSYMNDSCSHKQMLLVNTSMVVNTNELPDEYRECPVYHGQNEEKIKEIQNAIFNDFDNFDICWIIKKGFNQLKAGLYEKSMAYFDTPGMYPPKSIPEYKRLKYLLSAEAGEVDLENNRIPLFEGNRYQIFKEMLDNATPEQVWFWQNWSECPAPHENIKMKLIPFLLVFPFVFLYLLALFVTSLILYK